MRTHTAETDTEQPTVPNNVLRHLAIKCQQAGRRCSSEYLRQITKGEKRPSPSLAIELQEITGIAKETWIFMDQAAVNDMITTKYPQTGRGAAWIAELAEWRGVRV